MIGKIYTISTPYYDILSQTTKFKVRPALVISGPRNNDYTVLPISRVTNRKNLDKDYDVEVDIIMYPSLNLTANCYVRLHKQTTIHQSMLYKEISDLKTIYPELYLKIITLLESYNEFILENAL